MQKKSKIREEKGDKIKESKAGVNVLLIEDEEDIISMYSLGFEKAGFKVNIAKNGAWGVKAAQEKIYDIIILDMVMPAMDGQAVIKNLKICTKNDQAPIIALSNSAQDKDIASVKKMGVARYLLKSQITPSKIVQEIREVLKI